MYILIGVVIGFIVYLVYKENKREKSYQEGERETNKLEEESRQRILAVAEERKKNPILCKICTKKKHKKVYFEGLASYHCLKCSGHGFMSIYNDGCTACSNQKRFG